jgi:ParB/RepB/Spo0J family partition protein
MTTATLEAPNFNGHKKATKKPRAESRRATGGIDGQDAPATSAGPREVYGDSIVRLPLGQLVRHPDNRVPSESDIAERAASIERHGLLEPIKVRLDDVTFGNLYQVLSGETRWKACAKLGWKDIPARVVECDDAQALVLLAEHNAQRKDLNPIEKARTIERLCQSKEQGGAGLTREQAANVYGLETGAAASNLVRLLELPKIWQDRVATGELNYTWAREMLAYTKLEPVMKALDSEWKDRDCASWMDNAFHSREDLKTTLENLVDSECRIVSDEHWTGSRHAKLNLDCLTADAVREQLGLVEIEMPTAKKKGKLEKVLVATETKFFDELLKKQTERSAKAAAKKVGDDEDEGGSPAKPKAATAAELRAKAKERAEQLGKHVAAWRHKLLRRECIRAIDQNRDSGLRLLLAHNRYGALHGVSLIDLVEAAIEINGHYVSWKDVAPIIEPDREREVLKTMAKALLAHEQKDWRYPTIEHDLVEHYAADLGVDVAGAWIYLQAKGGDGYVVLDQQESYELLEEFFLLHRTDELKELAAELGVHVLPSLKTRDAIVKLILSVPQGTAKRLPLPKSIKPLPEAKSKAAAKSTAQQKGAKAAKGKRR